MYWPTVGKWRSCSCFFLASIKSSQKLFPMLCIHITSNQNVLNGFIDFNPGKFAHIVHIQLKWSHYIAVSIRSSNVQMSKLKNHHGYNNHRQWWSSPLFFSHIFSLLEACIELMNVCSNNSNDFETLFSYFQALFMTS